MSNNKNLHQELLQASNIIKGIRGDLSRVTIIALESSGKILSVRFTTEGKSEVLVRYCYNGDFHEKYFLPEELI